jgi:hypothetical protein
VIDVEAVAILHRAAHRAHEFLVDVVDARQDVQTRWWWCPATHET